MISEQTSTLPTSRLTVLDIMKGLGVLIIFYEHCAPIDYQYKRWSMSFLMPMFFLVAGYLYHPNTSISKDILKSAKRLVLPYILGVLAISLIHIFVHHDISWQRAIMWFVSAAGVDNYFCKYLSHWDSVGAFWFFMALFWCRVIFNAVYVNAKKYKYPILLLLSISGYLLLRYVIRLPFGISEGLFMMSFYLLGHLFKKAQCHYSLLSEKNRRYCDIISNVALFVSLYMWAWAITHSDICFSAGYCGHHLINIIAACGATYMFYWLCKGIAEHLPSLSRLLCFAGYGSLFLLWVHKVTLHYIFIWPFMFHISLNAHSHISIIVFLVVQWVVCLSLLLIASESKVLSELFGIYQPNKR